MVCFARCQVPRSRCTFMQSVFQVARQQLRLLPLLFRPQEIKGLLRRAVGFGFDLVNLSTQLLEQLDARRRLPFEACSARFFSDEGFVLG